MVSSSGNDSRQQHSHRRKRVLRLCYRRVTFVSDPKVFTTPSQNLAAGHFPVGNGRFLSTLYGLSSHLILDSEIVRAQDFETCELREGRDIEFREGSSD